VAERCGMPSLVQVELLRREDEFVDALATNVGSGCR
jgi:hypothetical protein